MRRLAKIVAAAIALVLSAVAQSTGAQNSADRHIEQARAHLAGGRVQQAIVAFGAALELDPHNAIAHNGLGSLLNSLGRFAEALPHVEAAVAVAPNNGKYRYNRGVVLAEHGRFAEAIADFDFALDREPDMTYAWLERGAAKLSLDDLAGARADWRQAAKSNSKLVWTRWYEATGHFVDGRFSEAAAGFDRVAEAEPAFIPAKLWRTIAHARAGTPIAAPEPGSSEWPAPALAYLRGEISEEELLRTAAEDQDSGDRRRTAEAFFFLSQYRLISGERQNAMAYLRKALAIPAPRHVWRVAAERDLRLRQPRAHSPSTGHTSRPARPSG